MWTEAVSWEQQYPMATLGLQVKKGQPQNQVSAKQVFLWCQNRCLCCLTLRNVSILAAPSTSSQKFREHMIYKTSLPDFCLHVTLQLLWVQWSLVWEYTFRCMALDTPYEQFFPSQMLALYRALFSFSGSCYILTILCRMESNNDIPFISFLSFKWLFCLSQTDTMLHLHLSYAIIAWLCKDSSILVQSSETNWYFRFWNCSSVQIIFLCISEKFSAV